VCKLDKALYGLNQAPRAWYSKLSAKLVKLGFMISKADTSLFIYNKARVIIYLVVYVDDIVVTSCSQDVIMTLLQDLRYDFALKDLGELHYFLGIQVTKQRDELLLTQEKYATEILQRASMQKYKTVKTPLAASIGIKQTYTPVLWCDNLGATHLLANPTFHERMKHVEVDYHFVRERVAKDLLDIRFISTNDQVADGFTKAVSAWQLENFRNNF
jgi:hypothetical protein